MFDPTRILIGVARNEAFFQARPTSYWREHVKADAADGALSESTIATFGFDPSAADVVLECFDDPDPKVRWACVLLLERCGSYREQTDAFRSVLDDADMSVQLRAIRALGRLRREALAAIPQLSDLAKSTDADIAANAVYALWSIDPPTARRVEEWSEFEAMEWGFRVQFPGRVETDSRRAAFFDSDLHEFWAQSGPSRFTVVLTWEIPDTKMTLEDRYDMAPKITARAMGGVVEKNERIEQFGLEGRDSEIKYKEGVTVRTRVLILGDRVYQAQVAYYPDYLHSEAVTYFLDSFEVTWRPEN